MVVEINLLEQKDKRNILPYLIIGLFAVCLLFVFIFFTTERSQLGKESEAIQQEVEQVQSRQELLHQSSGGGSSREKLAQSVEELQSTMTPALPIIRELVSLLPARGFFETFTLTSSSEVSLVVRFDTMQEVAQFTNTLDQQEFVQRADLSSVEAEVVDDTEDPFDYEPRHIANYFVTLDESYLKAEGVKE